MTYLAKLWGNKVLRGEITIEEVPNFLKEEVNAYVANTGTLSVKD